MTFVVLIAILAVAVCCGALGWRRASGTLYILLVALFLGVGCGPVAAWLLDGLQSVYAVKPALDWGQRNAIVLLGAGAEQIAHTAPVEPGLFSYPRIVEALALYKDCRKTQTDCKIVVSGGDAPHTGTAEAVVYRDTLVRLDIDAADVVLESESTNTWQNAQFTSALLRRYGPDRVLLVSSGIHLRRGTLYFSHFGIDAIPVRADYLRAVWSPLPLSYNLTVADFALHEYLGIARYRVYNALGWNPARQQPGQS